MEADRVQKEKQERKLKFIGTIGAGSTVAIIIITIILVIFLNQER